MVPRTRRACPIAVLPDDRGIQRPDPMGARGSCLRLPPNATRPELLPVEEGAGLDRRAGTRADQQIITPRSCGPATPAQPSVAGLVHLLPLRGVQSHLRLPRPVHLAPGSPLAAQTTPPHEDGRPHPPLPPWVATDRGRGDAVRPAEGDGQPLPLSGQQHPRTLGKGNTRISRITSGTDSWRARCSETGPPGSEGGLEKRSVSNHDNALQLDPTHRPRPHTRRRRAAGPATGARTGPAPLR